MYARNNIQTCFCNSDAEFRCLLSLLYTLGQSCLSDTQSKVLLKHLLLNLGYFLAVEISEKNLVCPGLLFES